MLARPTRALWQEHPSVGRSKGTRERILDGAAPMSARVRAGLVEAIEQHEQRRLIVCRRLCLRPTVPPSRSRVT